MLVPDVKNEVGMRSQERAGKSKPCTEVALTLVPSGFVGLAAPYATHDCTRSS